MAVEEQKRRCRDCRWWVVRTGCTCPEHLSKVERPGVKAIAFIPPKNEVYRHTECPYFERQKEGSHGR